MDSNLPWLSPKILRQYIHLKRRTLAAKEHFRHKRPSGTYTMATPEYVPCQQRQGSWWSKHTSQCFREPPPFSTKHDMTRNIHHEHAWYFLGTCGCEWWMIGPPQSGFANAVYTYLSYFNYIYIYAWSRGRQGNTPKNAQFHVFFFELFVCSSQSSRGPMF